MNKNKLEKEKFYVVQQPIEYSEKSKKSPKKSTKIVAKKTLKSTEKRSK